MVDLESESAQDIDLPILLEKSQTQYMAVRPSGTSLMVMVSGPLSPPYKIYTTYKYLESFKKNLKRPSKIFPQHKRTSVSQYDFFDHLHFFQPMTSQLLNISWSAVLRLIGGNLSKFCLTVVHWRYGRYLNKINGLGLRFVYSIAAQSILL